MTTVARCKFCNQTITYAQTGRDGGGWAIVKGSGITMTVDFKCKVGGEHEPKSTR